MFIDIDLPARAKRGLWSRLFTLLSRPGRPKAPQTAEELRAVQEFFAKNPSLGARVYRTRGGLRLLITSKEIDPGSTEALRIFDELRADPLYVRLCAAHRSFRARLSAKPWRCGVAQAPARYPYEEREGEMREWERVYREAAAPYAACELLEVVGNQRIDARLRPVIEVHDRECGVGSGRPLA